MSGGWRWGRRLASEGCGSIRRSSAPCNWSGTGKRPMTTFLLIRHGETDANGKSIMGWRPGWHLNARGREQVEKLARRLERAPIRAVYTSPLERALETAEPVAHRHRLEFEPL